ncbi:hypothetical protein [Planomonospora sp. ID82291]|uniref:hypothetical protein n=1 Tax=Planomonospora sp. ID82291 TaxID=2738136 RepID=UPI001A287DFC|nr:hypothetical protein [Planomonospora sp. ID82291]MBG0818451.1 hypothetical protein [Planomonospora sp. ID82291]
MCLSPVAPTERNHHRMTPTADEHTDLLTLPPGVRIPAIGDWAVLAMTPDSQASANLRNLAEASAAITDDLTNGAAADAAEQKRRHANLQRFHDALTAVTADMGPLKLLLTPQQATQLSKLLYRHLCRHLDAR